MQTKYVKRLYLYSSCFNSDYNNDSGSLLWSWTSRDDERWWQLSGAVITAALIITACPTVSIHPDVTDVSHTETQHNGNTLGFKKKLQQWPQKPSINQSINHAWWRISFWIWLLLSVPRCLPPPPPPPRTETLLSNVFFLQVDHRLWLNQSTAVYQRWTQHCALFIKCHHHSRCLFSSNR